MVGEWVGFDGGESVFAPAGHVGETVGRAGSALPRDGGCAPKAHAPRPGALRHTHLRLHAQANRPQARRPPPGPQHAPRAQTSLAVRRRRNWHSGVQATGQAGVVPVILRHGRDVGPVLAVLANVSSSLSSLSSAVAGRGAWASAFPYVHAMAHGGAASCALHRGGGALAHGATGCRVAGRGGPGQGAVKRVTPQLAAAECTGCCNNGVSLWW